MAEGKEKERKIKIKKKGAKMKIIKAEIYVILKFSFVALFLSTKNKK